MVAPGLLFGGSRNRVRRGLPKTEGVRRMVTVVANEPINLQHIAYLGGIADTGAAQFANETANGLDIIQGPIEFVFTGYGFQYIFGFPIGGTVTGLNILHNGASAYSFSDLSVSVQELESLFQAHSASLALHTLLAGDNHITGSKGNDVLIGYGRSDYLDGRSGNDLIIAGKGHDTLVAGAGQSTLVSGSGPDRFVFHTNPSLVDDNIAGFKVHTDKIVLEHNVFTMLPRGHLAAGDFANAAPTDASGQIVYDQATGDLSYYAHGNAGPGIHFATLTNHAALTHADLIVA
jgi:Ca2+-binding RTX toxin-like protein